jgi:hypothetical protein
VLVGLTGGASDGFVARRRDRSPARNPNGISTRADRAVAKYDRRGQAADRGEGTGATDGEEIEATGGDDVEATDAE